MCAALTGGRPHYVRRSDFCDQDRSVVLRGLQAPGSVAWDDCDLGLARRMCANLLAVVGDDGDVRVAFRVHGIA